MTIKLCIVEDYSLTRIALKYALNQYNDIDVVADFEDAESCLDFLNNNKVDMVIMDLGLPNMDGLEATKIIKEKFPETKVIIVTSHETVCAFC